jgi:hypothetical protein
LEIMALILLHWFFSHLCHKFFLMYRFIFCILR